jgi:hypothetical protein
VENAQQRRFPQLLGRRKQRAAHRPHRPDDDEALPNQGGGEN